MKTMPDEDHRRRLKQGAGAWNQWRNEHPDLFLDMSDPNRIDASLIGADLSGANLSRINLHGTDLSGSSLSHADLSGSDLSFTNLSGSNLSHANLDYANLLFADLSHANLNHAHLIRANLNGAGLDGTDLRSAGMWNTVLANIDLSHTKGLGTIVHTGPSPIALPTVQLPQDGSALHFLRGAGVSDEWITFYRATMLSPIEYHSCFLSYSSKDDPFARRLHADLQDQGVRCWFAPKEIKIGDKIRARIDEAIHLQDKLLLLLSEHALTSAWVEDEVEAALEKERRQQREVLFPVRLDETVMQASQAWAKQLRRSRHIGNFTDWTDPQAYQQAFGRLLRDLKAESDTSGRSGR